VALCRAWPLALALAGGDSFRCGRAGVASGELYEKAISFLWLLVRMRDERNQQFWTRFLVSGVTALDLNHNHNHRPISERANQGEGLIINGEGVHCDLAVLEILLPLASVVVVKPFGHTWPEHKRQLLNQQGRP
jgi:hypothetical protein